MDGDEDPEAGDPSADDPSVPDPSAGDPSVSDGSEAGDPSVSDGPEAGDEEEAGHVLPDEVEYPHNEEGATTGLPPRFEGWRRRSAAGAMLTGFAFGLREALEPTFNEPAIVLETSGVPPKDLAVEAELADIAPRQSVVRVRRWLLTDTPSGSGPSPSDGAGPSPSDDAGPSPSDDAGPSPSDGAGTPSPEHGDDDDGTGGRTTEIRSRQSPGRRRGERTSRIGRVARAGRRQGKGS